MSKELTSDVLSRLENRVAVMRRERWTTLVIETEELAALLAENKSLKDELSKWHPTTPEDMAAYERNLDR
jgi:hypothetical protein